MMPAPTPDQVHDLMRKIQAHLPGWHLNSIYQRHGRWIGRLMAGDEIDLSPSLELAAYIAKTVKNPPMLPEWRRKLTDKTAAEVEAMCRRLLKGNPNNRFVREQYPQLHAEITAEQQTATTQQGNHHGTEV